MEEIAHSFYTHDELDTLKNEHSGEKGFRTLEHFASEMGLTKCQVCENYHYDIAYDATVLVYGEAQRICLDCHDHRDSGDETFALKLATLYARQMLILTDETKIVRKDTLLLMETDTYKKIEPLTDDLLAVGRRRMQSYEWDEESAQLLLKEYSRAVIKIWKCKEIADETNYLLTDEGFTQETINKVFDETREYVNYHHHEHFLEVYGLQKSGADGRYWRV